MAVHIPYYLDFLPAPLLEELHQGSEPVDDLPGLRIAPGLQQDFPDIETPEALKFVIALYEKNRGALKRILDQRSVDRAFLDREVRRCVEESHGEDYLSEHYKTPIGLVDESGRTVLGPLPREQRIPVEKMPKVRIPSFLQGDQVTLFGPPDTEKMTINAMNALHRRPKDEPEIIDRLLTQSGSVPRWGADNEDSKTPIMSSFLKACRNLMGCFEKNLTFVDPDSGKHYALAEEGLATPIKRIPGLALPDGSHLYDGNPLPLHLYDFAMHLFHNWNHPEALIFYIPKLENEEEAKYLYDLIHSAEEAIKELHPSYEIGTIGLYIVFENPRAIFRIQEIATALHPYFLGGSLGWHDFLASTARLFRRDPNYRIPVKADPNIVINHIKESHLILVNALTPLGAIKIGGMYGILFDRGNQASYEVTMVGYIKDVITQLKRGLDGFWVAHPDFVRPGLAMVEAFRQWQDTGDDKVLRELVFALVPSESERAPLLEFVLGEDVPGLPEESPLYHRGVLAADIEISDVIANHDPEEVRYNVFQALQYLADWLRGNGCVALPATMTNASGEKVFVRIMDDLATTERSRWELWAEVAHERVSLDLFETILAEELEAIRTNTPGSDRRIEVKWDADTGKWYPIAARILHQLVTSVDPPEFASQLLLPFTFDVIRDANDPFERATELCPDFFST